MPSLEMRRISCLFGYHCYQKWDRGLEFPYLKNFSPETGRSLRTSFGEHQRAVIGNNDANQHVARHFNTGNHSVSDTEIRALCPFLVATIAAKDTK